MQGARAGYACRCARAGYACSVRVQRARAEVRVQVRVQVARARVFLHAFRARVYLRVQARVPARVQDTRAGRFPARVHRMAPTVQLNGPEIHSFACAYGAPGIRNLG